MSALAFSFYTEVYPDPVSSRNGIPARKVEPWYSFTLNNSYSINTLFTNDDVVSDDLSGLLFVPSLETSDPCGNLTRPYIPKNVTRLVNLPPDPASHIAIAPWISLACATSFVEAVGLTNPAMRAMLFYLPNSTEQVPPPANDPVWELENNGAWGIENTWPVYTIAGPIGAAMMQVSAQYSGNMTDVPYGHTLAETFDSHEYVRVTAQVDTAPPVNSLPSLWVFLLIVLGILLGVIGITSITMHYVQRSRRQSLRRRVANGEVDLEALGIKRLTIPQEVLDEMPLYTYGTSAPAADSCLVKEIAVPSKTLSLVSSRAESPDLTMRPAPMRSTSYHPAPLSQPTCAICLDDFIAASGDSDDQVVGTIVRELPCHHIFHPECVDTFLRDSSSLCPMCKKSALPKGYCPRVITNAMVRRERIVRRMRRRVADDAHLESAEHYGPRGPRSLSGFSTVIRHATFSRTSQYGRSEYTISAPFAQVEHSTPLEELANNELARFHSDGVTASAASRREWARQRAVAMLGRRAAPDEPDAVEDQMTPGWKKALRRLFPTVGR